MHTVPLLLAQRSESYWTTPGQSAVSCDNKKSKTTFAFLELGKLLTAVDFKIPKSNKSNKYQKIKKISNVRTQKFPKNL